MDAVAELTAEQGYEATKIADIVRRAGVARKTLYDNFDGKEEVFLATFDTAAKEFLTRMETACATAEGGWPERVETALTAFLEFVAERPEVARMCMVEALSATPAASQRRDAVTQKVVDLFRRSMPDDSGLPDTIDETLVGGVSWIVYQLVRRGEAERSLELLPELSKFILAPYAR